MKISHLYVLLLVFNLAGFPLVAGLTTYMGIDSTIYSIIIRSVILGLSILLFVLSKMDSKIKIVRGLFWIPLSVFWFAYIFRVYFDTFLIDSSQLSKEVSYYWIWAVGACFVPMLGLLTYPKIIYFKNAYKLSFIILMIASFLVTFLGSGIYTPEYGSSYETGRIRLESLNPISVGHLGVSLLLLSIWPFINSKKLSFGHMQIVINVVACLLGLYLLVASASRGPLVALIVVLLFYFIAQDLKRSWKVLTVIALLIVAVNLVGSYFEESGKYQFFSRSEGAFSGEDVAVSGRKLSYAGAINQFIKSPIFGDSLEEKTTRLYPHNVVLESFMATGLIGGLSFLFLIIYGAYVSFKIAKIKSEHGWIALIFMQYLIGAQFTGAIYEETTMWTFFAITIVLYSSRNNAEVILKERSLANDAV